MLDGLGYTDQHPFKGFSDRCLLKNTLHIRESSPARKLRPLMILGPVNISTNWNSPAKIQPGTGQMRFSTWRALGLIAAWWDALVAVSGARWSLRAAARLRMSMTRSANIQSDAHLLQLHWHLTSRAISPNESPPNSPRPRQVTVRDRRWQKMQAGRRRTNATPQTNQGPREQNQITVNSRHLNGLVGYGQLSNPFPWRQSPKDIWISYALLRPQWLEYGRRPGTTTLQSGLQTPVRRSYLEYSNELCWDKVAIPQRPYMRHKSSSRPPGCTRECHGRGTWTCSQEISRHL